VASGVVYFGCDSALCALSATTGQLLWNYFISGGVLATPAIANNLVYIGTPGGHLNALSATSGTVVWNYATGFPITDAPLSANGLVYIGATNGNLYALNGRTGHLVWERSFRGNFSTPSIDGSLLYVSAGESLYALQSQTGKIVWHVGAKGGTPVIANGMIYLSDAADSKLLAFNEHTGSLLWSDAISDPTDPAVANGLVYVADYCILEAVSAASGTLIWQDNMTSTGYCGGSGFSGLPSIANGVVYMGGFDDGLPPYSAPSPDNQCGTVFIYSATTGVKLAEVDNGYTYNISSPIVSNGILYTPSDGGMYAYHLT
jgi:outer membrane protein assembly factor BamB